MIRLRPVVAALLLGAVITSCGGGADAPVDPGTPSVSVTVSLSGAPASLAAGASQQLTATVSGTTSQGVLWSSSAEGVARVSASGMLTAVAPGTATITARAVADESKSASATVSVTAAALASGTPVGNLSGAAGSRALYQITVPAGSAELVVETTGGTGDLDLYVRAGQTVDTVRADCASAGAAAAERCVIVSPAAGTWSVMLNAYEAYAGVTLAATARATATTPGFTLYSTADAVSVTQGTSVQVPVLVRRAPGFTGPITLTYISGADGVTLASTYAGTIPADVSTTTVTVTASATAGVRSRGFWVLGAASGVSQQGFIVPLEVKSSTGGGSVVLSLDPVTATVQVGAPVSLQAVVSGTSNTAVTWTSSNPTVATVTGGAAQGGATTGTVRGVAPGTTTITATSVADPSKVKTSTVTVIPATASTGAWSAISAGFRTTCALTPAGKAYCWGENRDYGLGDGVTTASANPVAVAGNLTWRSIAVQPGGSVCGTVSSGFTYCWGLLPGNGSSTVPKTPVQVGGGLAFQQFIGAAGGGICGLVEDGTMYCWGDGSAWPNRPASITTPYTTPVAQTGHRWRNFGLGYFHGCGVEADGKTYCWGRGAIGIYNTPLPPGSGGIATTPVRIENDPGLAKVYAATDLTCGVRDDGAAYCWGTMGDRPGAGLGTNTTLPVRIAGLYATMSLNENNACALTAGGQAYCWGHNNYGMNGDGTTVDRHYTPTAVVGGHLFSAISAGDDHVCGIVPTRGAMCWGRNEYDSLGDGTKTNRNVPTLVTVKP